MKLMVYKNPLQLVLSRRCSCWKNDNLKFKHCLIYVLISQPECFIGLQMVLVIITSTPAPGTLASLIGSATDTNWDLFCF